MGNLPRQPDGKAQDDKAQDDKAQDGKAQDGKAAVEGDGGGCLSVAQNPALKIQRPSAQPKILIL